MENARSVSLSSVLPSDRTAPARLAFWIAVYSALLLTITVVNLADAGLPQVPAFLATLPELWALWCMRGWVLTAPAAAALTRRTRQAWLIFGFSPLLWLVLTLLGRLLPDWPEESFPLRFNVVSILLLFVMTFYFAAAVRDTSTNRILPVRATVRGTLAEWNPGEHTPGESLDCDHAFHEVTYYDLFVDNREWFAWGVRPRIGRSFGVDWFGPYIAALGA